MTKAQERLIKLLTSAFGGPVDAASFTDTDWKEVLDQSYKQEVNSLAFDGYQKLHASLKGAAFSLDDLIDWIGQTNYQETQYESQGIASNKLAVLFDSKCLTTFVLKGTSIALCYPVPSHRHSCDFDCYLVNSTNNSNSSYEAHEIGNMIVEERGIDVNRSYYKDSSFNFDGLHVENHRFCCSIKRGKRTKELETYLEGLLRECQPEYIEESRLALPPLMFQALFLVEHACGHFLYEKMSMKNICDWAMFRRRHKEHLDWTSFNTLCERYSLNNFADTLGRLSDYILGDCEYLNLTTIDKRVLEDTFKEVNMPNNKMLQRIRKSLDVLRSSWKFRYFSSDPMVKELFHSIYSFLFDRD